MLLVHATHLDEPAGANVPAAQGPHTVSLCAVQAVVGALPAAQVEHVRQETEPAAPAYVLGAQSTQVAAPTAAALPLGHCAQTVFAVAVHAVVGALPPGHVVHGVQLDAIPLAA